MGSRLRQRLGDLGWAGLPGNRRHVQNPHENLRVRPDNVDVRQAAVIGMDPYADGAEALQCRHKCLSIVIAPKYLAKFVMQLLHYSRRI